MNGDPPTHYLKHGHNLNRICHKFIINDTIYTLYKYVLIDKTF